MTIILTVSQIQESVVLPNMDDISFFESIKYQHRGGIWADASRAHADTSYGPMQEEDDETKPSGSASSTDLSKSTPADSEHPPVQRSCTVDEAQTEAKVVNDPQEAYMDLRRTTTAVSLPNSPAANVLTNSRRRRTWLGAPDEEDGDELKLDDGDEADRRGRTSDSERTPTRRSSSTPLALAEDATQQQPTEAPPLREEYLAPSVSRRSSSQHSQLSERGTSGSATDEESASGPGDSSSSSWRSKSPGLGSTPNRPNNATSSTAAFLQTLKSRAGDKQALSNTAKEAMRKWGVNWSGLRKENTTNTHNEDVADGASTPQNDTRPRTNSAAHRARPSYAEVRAAVERRHQGNSLGADLHSDSISIPQDGNGKERARSVSPSPAEDAGSSSSELSYLAPPSTDTPHKPDSRSSSPAFERTASGRSVPGLMVEESEERPAAPIHTQPPQARTMTIPGIHASHRGEVMSMGYAPSPPPPEQKKPAIQSVYRLWNKTPSQTSRGAESAAVTQTETGFAGRDQDASAAASAATSDAQAQPEVITPRPVVPPPLPPRSVSGTLGRSSGAAVTVQGAGPSAASAALQSIVSKDRSKRASLEPPPSSGPYEDAVGTTGSGSLQTPAANSKPGGADGPGGSPTQSGTPKPRLVPPALPPRRPSAVTPAAPAGA